MAALTFVGNRTDIAAGVAYSMYWWMAGLVFAAFTTAMGFASQFNFYKAHSQKVAKNQPLADHYDAYGRGFRIAAYFLGSLSLIVFLIGTWSAIGLLARVS